MNSLNDAVDVLEQGGIIIYPTDTAFGIGCRIDDEKAVKRLFEIRKRPLNKPTPVLFESFSMLKLYTEDIPDAALDLMEKYWPGALTLVLKANKERVNDLITAKTGTIGVRIPNHTVPKMLIKKIKVPIIGTSANFAGDKTPFDFSEINKQLISKVDFAIDGMCIIKQESTVVDCTKDKLKILRVGAIKIEL